MNYARGLSVTALATGLTFALGFANQALLARMLGEEGRGALAALATTVLLATLVIGEWVNRGNTFIAGHQPTRASSLLSLTLVWTALLSVVFAIGLWLAGPWLAAAISDQLSESLSVPVLWWAGVLTILLVVQRGAQAILLGLDRLRLYNVVPVLFIVVYLGGNALLAATTATPDVLHVLGVWCVAVALSGVVAIAACGRPVLLDPRPLLRQTAKVGSRGAVSATLVFLMFRSVIYLVGALMSLEALGVFTIAVIIAEMIQRLPNIAGTVLLPKVMAGQDADHTMSLRIGQITLVLSLLVSAAVVLFGRFFITVVFSAPYAGAYEPLCLMLPGLVASGFASILNSKLAATGYPPVTLWAPAVALVLNVGLNYRLIPDWGLAGAATSTSVAYIFWAVAITVAYRQHTGLQWHRLLATSADHR